MFCFMFRTARLLATLVCLGPFVSLMQTCHGQSASSDQGESLQLVVMDPLAAPLSCPCVEGYAQRQYEALAEFLQGEIGRPFELTFAESLQVFRKKRPNSKPDLIIGKHSVVRHDAATLRWDIVPFAQLTDQRGDTTQQGLFVVPSGDQAQTIDDLKGYRILFGPKDSDEKHAAAIRALKSAGVAISERLETCTACSDGATKILELAGQEPVATVISSYAAPLLEGCGTIKKGDLRVIDKTKPVPFITAFGGRHLSDQLQQALRTALIRTGEDAQLCLKLETLLGFVPLADEEKEERSAPDQPPPKTSDLGWPGWLGADRDGHCVWLPERLPSSPKIIWSDFLGAPGLGGVAANEDYVVVGDRDIEDRRDVFRCYVAADGVPLWEIAYDAPGKLDYGNSPRATPLIQDDRVFLHGAFGHLHCVDLASGKVVWQRNLGVIFGKTAKRPWGSCASPLIVDGRLIVHPGAADAFMAALAPDTGEMLWKTPGVEPAYGSFMGRQVHGQWQVIGHDKNSLGGWDAATGKKLWQISPPNDDDFNVPTPLNFGEQLLITSENNGTRLYDFDDHGRLRRQPLAENLDVSPDISTPVVVGSRVFCVFGELVCMDGPDGLRTSWVGSDPSIDMYASLITDGRRLLIIGDGGELLLVDAHSDEFSVLSRLDVFPGESAEMYSHPAIVGTRLYLRGDKELVCLELAPSAR